MSEKKVSSGVIVTNGKYILVGHVTGEPRWICDIPKGRVEPDESFLQAAIRELKEETGLEAESDILVPMGVHAYTKNKDLALYLWVVTELPELASLFCASRYSADGESHPELDWFAYAPWSDLEEHVRTGLAKVLRIIEPRVKQLTKKPD
jgi:putative (di)nucleoside polyphosphate hydrolase